MAETREQRKLAAILSADVVGYSRLMGVDESGTLLAWKGHLNELIDPMIEEHNGRVVKLVGDGILAEFASAVDTVRCGVEIQGSMAGRNAEVPEDVESLMNALHNSPLIKWLFPALTPR